MYRKHRPSCQGKRLCFSYLGKGISLALASSCLPVSSCPPKGWKAKKLVQDIGQSRSLIKDLIINDRHLHSPYLTTTGLKML